MGYGRHATHSEQYATSSLTSGVESEILKFLLWMKREGYSESSIRNVRKVLQKLARRIGTLLDGDTVKDHVSNMDVRGGTKKNNLLAYKLYATWKGFKFDIPRVADTEPQLPFIPLEAELDCLIHSKTGHISDFPGKTPPFGTLLHLVYRLEDE